MQINNLKKNKEQSVLKKITPVKKELTDNYDEIFYEYKNNMDKINFSEDKEFNKKSTNDLYKMLVDECDKSNKNTNVDFEMKKNNFFSKLTSLKLDEIDNYLEKSNIDYTYRDFWGNNLLISLSLNNKTDLLEKLIEKSFEGFSKKVIYDFMIHLTSSDFLSYSEQKRIKFIKSIIWKTGIDIINKQDDYGNTIITHSLSSTEILNYLLTETNIDLEIVNLCGNNPVSYCIQNSNDVSLTKLIDYMKQNYTIEKSKKILNIVNELGDSPILLAVKSGNVKNVQKLLNTGLVDLNVKNPEGKTPLLISIEEKFEEIYEMLLEEKYVDINMCDNCGNTPLTKAIESNQYKLIFNLLKKNVNINNFDPIKRSSLLKSLILKYNSPKILSPIRENIVENFNGFNLIQYSNISECFNKLEPDYSLHNNLNLSCPEILIKKSKNDNIFKSSSQLCDVILSKLIKNENTDVNSCDLEGNTPFSVICENNDIFLFDLLLSNKSFDPTQKNIKNMSPYDFIKNKYEDMICEMFGNINYCPVTNTNTNNTFNINEISEKKLNFESFESLEDSENSKCFEYDINNSEAESLNDISNNNLSENLNNKPLSELLKKITEIPNVAEKISKLLGEITNSKNLHEKINNLLTDYKNDLNRIEHVCKHHENKIKITEIKIKQFGTIKYFYEQTQKKMKEMKNN